MIRLTCMSGQWIGAEIGVLDEEQIYYICEFVNAGEPVLLIESLDYLPEEIDKSDVTLTKGSSDGEPV